MRTSRIDPLFFREVGTITFVSFLEHVSVLLNNIYLILKCDVRLGLTESIITYLPILLLAFPPVFLLILILGF